MNFSSSSTCTAGCFRWVLSFDTTYVRAGEAIWQRFVFNSNASIACISVDTDCDPASNPAKNAGNLREHGLLGRGIGGTFGAENHIEGIVGK